MVKIAKAKTQSSKDQRYETAEQLSEEKQYLDGKLGSDHQISKSQNHENELNNDELDMESNLSSQDDGIENSQDFVKGGKGISKNEKRQVKRLLQNRVSAQRFRQKRKNEFENLKDNLRRLIQENEMLRNQVQELNAMLKHQQEIYAAQEVQMQAIQSSLMEMFCKQVLTQQNGPNGAVNPQAQHQLNEGPQSQPFSQINNQMGLPNMQGMLNQQEGMGPQLNQMAGQAQNDFQQQLQMQLLNNLQNGQNMNAMNPMNNHSSPSDINTQALSTNASTTLQHQSSQSLANPAQGPQNTDLIKNLQNLLEMQGQQDQGLPQGQGFPQSLNKQNGAGQNNLAMMLQNLIKNGNQVPDKNDIGKDQDEEMMNAEQEKKLANKYGSSMQGPNVNNILSQAASQGMQNNGGVNNNQMLIAALQNLAGNQGQNNMMQNPQNYDLMNGMQQNYNNGNQNISQNKGDQTNGSNQQHDPNANANYNSLKPNNKTQLIQKIQQQLMQKIQNSNQGANGQLTPLAPGARSPLLGGPSNVGPSPNLKGIASQYLDKSNGVSQGGLTPRSMNNRRNSQHNIFSQMNGNNNGGAFQSVNQQNKAKMALPIVLVKNGSPKTNGQSQGVVTPKSNIVNNNQSNGSQMGTALEALLKQLRHNSSYTPGGPGQKKNSNVGSPMLGGNKSNAFQGIGQKNGFGDGNLAQITQLLKSQMSSNGQLSNMNGLSTPQGFDLMSNNNIGHQDQVDNVLNVQDMGHQEGEKQPQEITQLNRTLAYNHKSNNNFSFVNLNMIPIDQKEALEKSAQQMRENSPHQEDSIPLDQGVGQEGNLQEQANAHATTNVQ